jgi:deoxycytidylate deaminase
VRKNKIVKIGLNKNRTHPEISRHPYHEGYVGLHAELDCILKTDRENLSDCEIVVLRIDKNSKLNNSKPCAGCASLLRQFNLKKIYYSTSDGKIESYS